MSFSLSHILFFLVNLAMEHAQACGRLVGRSAASIACHRVFMVASLGDGTNRSIADSVGDLH